MTDGGDCDCFDLCKQLLGHDTKGHLKNANQVSWPGTMDLSGVLECWNIVVLGFFLITPLLHHSITPALGRDHEALHVTLRYLAGEDAHFHTTWDSGYASPYLQPAKEFERLC
jgi:hypothetical protein